MPPLLRPMEETVAVILLIVGLVLLLAWANDANDVSRGVATLAGSGVARSRPAVLRGAARGGHGGFRRVAGGPFPWSRTTPWTSSSPTAC